MHTFGNTQLKLIAQGYIPASLSGSQGHRAADEPAAILLIPSYGNGSSGVSDAGTRNVGALTISVRDTAARAAVLKVFAKHGLDGKSPHRVDSAKNLTFIFALSAYELPCSQQTKPFNGEYGAAVSLDTFTRSGASGFPESFVVAVSGEWVNGSPLEISRSNLPTVDIDAVFKDVEALLSGAEPAYKPAQLSPEMQAAMKRKRKEREELEAAFAECTDFEILRLVEARRPKKRLGDGAWADLSPEALKRQTVELYQAVVAERQDAAKLTAHRRKLGIGV